jgi:hypothetical protein
LTLLKTLRILLGLLFATLAVASPTQAPPTFTEIDLGIEGYEVRWGDCNNDGLLDLAIQGFVGGARFCRIYLRNPGLPVTFTEDPNDGGMLGLTEGHCSLGDFDNDGDLDFAYSGWSGGGTGSKVYRNDLGTAWPQVSGPRGMKGSDGAWFDYDHDGDLDLLLTGESYDTGMGDYTIIYRNDGGGTFVEAVNLAGTYLGEVSVGDYDRDGDIDVALIGRSVGAAIYRNNGDGTFTDIGAGLPWMINASIAWGDIDNDGDLDLVISGEDSGGTLRMDIYRNNSGTFTSLSPAIPPMRLGHIAWGDYDNDGDIDMLMVGSTAGPAYTPLAYVFRNDGAGNFTDAGIPLTGVANQSTCHWGDYDNDGDLDIVVSGTPVGGVPVVKIYTNNSGVANTAPTVPAGPGTTRFGNAVTFHWDASTDAQTPTAGLTYNLRVGTTPGGQQILAPMADLATGRRRIPERGNAQQNLHWTLRNLPPGTYYWSVQAIDNGTLASGWASEQSVVVPGTTTVTAMSPTPGTTLLSPPTTITLTLSGPVDPATVTTSTVRLVRGGNDGALNTGDDVEVVPAGVSVIGGNQIQVDLTGVVLPNNPYRVRLVGVSTADPSAVGRWALDETSGVVAIDTSGQANDGALINGPTHVGGKTGNALHFNGVDQEVIVPDASVHSTHAGPSGQMTLSAWVRMSALPSAGTRTTIVGKGENNDWEYALFVYSTGVVAFAVTQPDITAYAEAAGGAITPGVWHHVAGTVRKGVAVKLWLDGIPLDNRLNFGGDSFDLNAPLRFGRSGTDTHPAEFLNGDVDDVRIFSTELTAAQIQNLATLGGAVRDTAGNIIDGEFAGTFASGNGAPGGSFVADFTVNVAPLKVTAMAPAPGSALGASPADIVLTFNGTLDAATANASAVRLIRAGPDTALGTGDDVVVTPSSVALLSPNQIRIVPGALPNDQYRLTLSATPTALSGRVNYWAMDEGTGPIAGDPPGGATGAIIGPLWAPGRVNNALHYNGISDTTNTGAPPLAPPWTAGMWVKREDSPSGDARLMDPAVFSGGTLRLESFNNTNLVGVAVYTVADYPSNYTAPVGQWVHLAFVGTASQTHLYVDGNFQNTMSAGISVPRYFIGSHGYNTMLGTIDDIQIYGRNLSAAEIQTLASFGGAVRDANSNRLDGEFGGTLPSGNNVPGGDFVATFTVTTPGPPGSFTLSVPLNGATGVSTTPSFSWTGASGAATYTLQIATDAAFTSVVSNVPGLATTTYVQAVPLAFATPHFWRVTAVNANGSTPATGVPFSFVTVAPPTPGSFSLASPGIGAVNQPVTPTFIWTASAGASSYTLEVSTDPLFGSTLVNLPGIPTTFATPPMTLAFGTVYYWRVTAVNAGGTTLMTGSPASLTTQQGPGLVAGGCGLTGWEGLVLLALLAAARRIRNA